MKKKFIIIIIVIATLVGWFVIVPLCTNLQKIKESKQLETLSKRNWEEFVDDSGWDIDENMLTYYGTMEEALQKSDMFSGISYTQDVDKEIKRMENDEYGMFFYVSFFDNNKGAIMGTKFKIREEKGKRQYALFTIEPIEGTRDQIIIGTFEEAVHDQLTLNDFHSVNGIDRNKRFVWSCSTYKDIYDLTVEGQKPTEIIPYEFLGKTEYFWYFNDIESTKPGAALEFKVGEK